MRLSPIRVPESCEHGYSLRVLNPGERAVVNPFPPGSASFAHFQRGPVISNDGNIFWFNRERALTCAALFESGAVDFESVCEVELAQTIVREFLLGLGAVSPAESKARELAAQIPGTRFFASGDSAVGYESKVNGSIVPMLMATINGGWASVPGVRVNGEPLAFNWVEVLP